MRKARIYLAHLLIVAVIGAGGAASAVTLGRISQPLHLRRFPILPVRVEEDIDTSPITAVFRGVPPDIPGMLAQRSVRVIRFEPGRLMLYAGGQVVRRIPADGRSMGLSQLAALIDDPSWIGSGPHGTFTLRAALVAVNGATLRVGGPCRRLLLADRMGVFLGARHATLLIQSATVQSGVPAYRGRYRPFVLADNQSRLVISRSRLIGLGWNWTDSYGVSWKSGTTGGATNSTFSGNYFGIYTGGVSGVRIANNYVHGNYFYGIDPHTGSTGLAIVHNLVVGNGRHGIILAEHVTRSLVTGNTVLDNAANGIIVDEDSTGNVIDHNLVAANGGDGIVLTGSPSNRVLGNIVRANRVGVRFTGTDPSSVLLQGNVVSANDMDSEGAVSLAGNIVTSSSQVTWNDYALLIIWVLAGVLVIVTLISLRSCLREAGRPR